MEIVKYKMCGADLHLADDQSTAKCSCGYTPEIDSVSDADIVNEIDSLLSLYKTAIDGDVWSELSSVFPVTLCDDAQDEQEMDVSVDAVPLVRQEPQSVQDTESEQEETSVLSNLLIFIQKNKLTSIVTAGAVCIAIIFLIVLNSVIIPNLKNGSNVLSDGNQPENTVEQVSATEKEAAIRDSNYQNAVSLMNGGKYDEAIAAFVALNGYQDSASKISRCHYSKAAASLESGDTLMALRSFSAAGDYEDAPAQAAALRRVYLKSLQAPTVSAGRNHTLALKPDGTVMAAGNNDHDQCDVSDWTDIVAVGVGDTHTVGLRGDGTVVHIGAVNYGQRGVTAWSDIVAISAGKHHTVGLTTEGTVRASGLGRDGQCEVWQWQDIAAVCAGDYHTVGLKTDGTVIATGYNPNGQCDVSDWTDIVAVYAADHHTIGLKADGTVVSTGRNAYGQCDVSDWKDIIDIGIGTSFTVGLKADGTLVTVGYSYGDLEEVCDWTDIIAISVGASHVVGLKPDGTVVTVNYTSEEQATMSGWTNIKLPE